MCVNLYHYVVRDGTYRVRDTYPAHLHRGFLTSRTFSGFIPYLMAYIWTNGLNKYIQSYEPKKIISNPFYYLGKLIIFYTLSIMNTTLKDSEYHEHYS